MAQNTQTPAVDFFKFDLGNNSALQKDFQKIFEENNGNWAKIKPQLEGNKAFINVLPKLEFTQNLSVLSNNNEAFVAHFQKDATINSMADIGLKLNKVAFVAQVQEFTPVGEDKMVFANNAFNQVFNQVPTAVLVNMIEDPKVPILNNVVGSQTAEILKSNPHFNIKTTSVYNLINDTKNFEQVPAALQAEVTTQLKTLGRLVNIAHVPEAVPILYNKNLHTSGIISSIPPNQFLAMMKDNGLSDEDVHQIHQQAQIRTAQIQDAMMGMYELERGINFGIMKA